MHDYLCTQWGKDNPWEWGPDCAQSWRMSGDHTPVWTSTKQQIQLSAKIPAEYSGKPYGWVSVFGQRRLAITDGLSVRVRHPE